MNEALLKPLSNQKPKAIYPSSLIRANNVSLDKGSDHEFASTRIMTKRTRGLGRLPGKRKIFQQKKVSQTPDTTEILASDFQKTEVEQKYVDQRKRRENASV